MMYCRVGIAHQDRNGGQCPPYFTAPAPVILVKNAG
jgi:hypothetical protein